MALLTSGMPYQSGETERDIRELYSWASRLTTELRALLCNLDGQNVIEARSVKASGIKGMISASQLPQMTYCNIGMGEGVNFLNDDGETVASIYCTDAGLVIEAANVNISGTFTVNGAEIGVEE